MANEPKVYFELMARDEEGSCKMTLDQVICPEIGNDFCDAFARVINSFMVAKGYTQFNKEKVFLESITEEEEEELFYYLQNTLRATEEKTPLEQLSELYDMLKKFPKIQHNGEDSMAVHINKLVCELTSTISDYWGTL